MKRRYKAEKLEKDITKIKSLNNDVCIGLDVITGFPGETQDDFTQTYDFIARLPISYLHVFTYSERKNTPAATFIDKIPISIRKERTNILKNLSDLKLSNFYKEQVDKLHEFIPEKFIPDEQFHYGHTSNYLNCKIKVNLKLENKIYSVKTVKIDNDKKMLATMI